MTMLYMALLFFSTKVAFLKKKNETYCFPTCNSLNLLWKDKNIKSYFTTAPSQMMRQLGYGKHSKQDFLIA